MFLLTALALIGAGFVSPAHAQETEITIPTEGPPSGFGAGLLVGEPSGLSLAWRFGERSHLQGHASYSFFWNYARFGVDYVGAVAVVDWAEANGRVPIGIGLGATLATGVDLDGLGVGGRVPFQVAYLNNNFPLEVFAEIAPAIYVLPDATAGLEGSIGARYYFF